MFILFHKIGDSSVHLYVTCSYSDGCMCDVLLIQVIFPKDLRFELMISFEICPCGDYDMVHYCYAYMQRGELASDRARDSQTKSLILTSMSAQQYWNSNESATAMGVNPGGELTTEYRLQTMRTEISTAAVEHRNLVARMNDNASNNARDARSDSDTDSSSETRSLSSSTTE